MDLNVNGRKMETNWKAMSVTAVAARPEVDVSSTSPLRITCIGNVNNQTEERHEGKKHLRWQKKTWKRIKYQAVNRAERKNSDQVSRITATLPQPLVTDYLLWGGEGLIKYCPVKPVPCDTQEAQRKGICASLYMILHRNQAPKQNLSDTLSLGDTLLCDFYFPPAELGLLDVLDAEVAAAVSVDLGLVPRGGLIIGAVGVGRSCETESTRADCCGKKNTHTYGGANYETCTANSLSTNLCVSGWKSQISYREIKKNCNMLADVATFIAIFLPFVIGRTWQESHLCCSQTVTPERHLVDWKVTWFYSFITEKLEISFAAFIRSQLSAWCHRMIMNSK